jgi:hypothetical protein
MNSPENVSGGTSIVLNLNGDSMLNAHRPFGPIQPSRNPEFPPDSPHCTDYLKQMGLAPIEVQYSE